MDRKDKIVEMLTALSRNETAPMLQLCMPEIQIFVSGNPQAQSLDMMLGFVSAFHQAFTDYRFVIEDVLSDGDLIAVRSTNRAVHTGAWMGLPPTGNTIEYGEMMMFRFEGELIKTCWAQNDDLLMMQQLGMLQLPSGEAQPPAHGA